jgi:hypothetical protein
MIIQVDGASAEDVAAARRSLEGLVGGWGVEVAEVPAETTGGAQGDDRSDKVDPVALASLVISTALAIPSAVLAVKDLADRMRKRRRAKELIDRVQELGDRRVSVLLVKETQTIEIRGLDPDRLLELLADDDQAD